MRCTDEQIGRYLEILNNYSNQQQFPQQEGCKCKNFFAEAGYNICEECGVGQGHRLGYFNKKEYKRFHFRKKSIYQRKYHYEKKIAEISKKLPLTEEQKYCLYKKLMAIDRDKMQVLNKLFCRKRMISIDYLVKTFLQVGRNENYKLLSLKISNQTLENYEKWWRCYKNL